MASNEGEVGTKVPARSKKEEVVGRTGNTLLFKVKALSSKKMAFVVVSGTVVVVVVSVREQANMFSILPPRKSRKNKYQSWVLW